MTNRIAALNTAVTNIATLTPADLKAAHTMAVEVEEDTDLSPLTRTHAAEIRNTLAKRITWG